MSAAMDPVAMPAELALPAAAATTPAIPAQVTVPVRTLAYILAGLLTLFTGGQVAVQRLQEPGQAPSPALTAQLEQLSREVSDLKAQTSQRDAQDRALLRAILLYVVESDRAWREAKGSTPVRSPELERAASRVTELAAQ